MCFLMYQRHYRVHLSYDLTTFQILGQKLSKNFDGILVQTMTPKGHFEINWPLVESFKNPLDDAHTAQLLGRQAYVKSGCKG